MTTAARIHVLAPKGLTIRELRRRLRGQGPDRLTANFVGRVIMVSPEFGHAIEHLAFSGAIRIDSDLHVWPGRAYATWRDRSGAAA